MNAVEKTKSLRVEHLSDIIADLRVQKEDRISELCDLKKVRTNLEEKAESGNYWYRWCFEINSTVYFLMFSFVSMINQHFLIKI